MLNAFLFIGIGGSGGKTLWTLKADLEQRLKEVGYDGEWPACWQLLHIDVPTTADGADQELPDQLEEKDYIGLVPRGVNYRSIDDSLISGGRADEQVLENLLGWRPEPGMVVVPVSRGAGQYRALGRAITLAGMDNVASAIRHSLQALQSSQVIADLAAVSRAFGAPVIDNTPAPEAVVISSLAGGSGSGAFMDVCDALRALGGSDFADEMWSVLYAPDVFNHLSPDDRKGVHPNALAALCELLAGFWDPEPVPEDLAIIEGKGIAVGAPSRRGPRFPLIVGTKNNRVSFDHQNKVYRAMGTALAAWVVSGHLQDDLKGYATGNWLLSSDKPDTTQLRTNDQEQPFSSIGFARVSLGRDRFADYASERLARGAVERILRQHLADRPPDADPNHEIAIEEVVTATFVGFLQGSGLDERGEDHNQILDAIRPLDRKERLTGSTETVRASLVAGQGKPVASRTLLAVAIDLLREEQRSFVAQESLGRLNRAKEFVPAIQEQLLALTARHIAVYGAPVTVKLLERLRAELEFVITELPEEEAKYRLWAGRIDQMVSGVLKPSNDAIKADNPVILEAITKGVDCFDYLAEADLRVFVVALTKDILHNLVEPLHTAVRAGRELLGVRERGTSSQPSIVDRWPVGDVVPRRFHPAGNEFVLESTDRYPAIFRESVAASASVKDPGGAEAEFVRHTIVGSAPTEKDRQTLIAVNTAWVPAIPGLQETIGVASRAQFKLGVEPADLLLRARELVEDRDSPIGQLVGESLQDYLDDRKVEPAELDDRLNRFRDAFVQTLNTSEPLINVDPRVLMRVHQTEKISSKSLFTEIPFGEGTPGYKVVRKVLEGQGKWGPDTISAFTDGRQSRIDVFSVFVGTFNPVIFESIVGPIAAEWSKRRSDPNQRSGFWRWRRARPLATFLPLAPGVRRAMIRGWFTARLLNDLVFDPDHLEKMAIWHPGRKKVLPFPDPLLGPPVFDEWERLPAVLESLPIALVAFAERAHHGDDALAPYWRLRELGLDGRGADNAYQGANKELDNWIRRGITTGGPNDPDPEFAGPPGEGEEPAEFRKVRCAETIGKLKVSYGDLVDRQIELDEFFSIPRIAEIGRDLTMALVDLDGAVQKIETKSGGIW